MFCTREEIEIIIDVAITVGMSLVETNPDLLKNVGCFGQKLLHDIFVDGRYLH